MMGKKTQRPPDAFQNRDADAKPPSIKTLSLRKNDWIQTPPILMHVGDDDAHTVQEITVDNCGKATLQPVGKKNRNMRGPNRNKRNKQIKRMVTHTAAIPVQKAKGAILEPKMTIKAQQELEAARVFVEKSRTEQDELHEKDVAMVAEYSDEIFEHLLSREKELKFKTVNIDQQLESFWDPRSRLMDWLVEVHNDSGLVLEILFLAVNYLDRYFSTKEDIQDLHLKLIGATSLLIASKYELDNLPYGEPVNYLVKKADGAFDESELLKAERRMLKKLDYALGWPDPMSFLRRISRADNYEPKRGTLAKYFLYITVVDKHFVGCVPSFLSAGAYCLRRYMLGKSDWSKRHVYYSGYTLTQLQPLVSAILECCAKKSSKRFPRASKCVKRKVSEGFSLPWDEIKSTSVHAVST